MSVESKKQPNESVKLESPCGNGCQYFVLKTCSGEDSGCAEYWRFSQGLK